MSKLIHKGSVKDIYENDQGELIFRFSDRYSIFDWGQMPDPIPGKGRALASMGESLLKLVAAAGVPTHFLRPGERDDEFVVKKVEVPRTDIARFYENKPANALIPLEVIFRFGVPTGSSLLKRFPGMFEENERFSGPRVDFTTKLERMDRVLTEEEAQELCVMDDKQWQEMKATTEKVASLLDDVFTKLGFQLWDGKLEFAFDENRKPMLVDSIGLDEMRLTENGVPLSKEILRQYYKETEWYSALESAKKTHPQDFKNYCANVLKIEPAPLDPERTAHVAGLYQKVADCLKSAGRSK